jgi:2-oxoisovalerate dehydrogenase E1 component alpha subunit
MADQAFFDEVDAESDQLAAHVRQGCLDLPDPSPLSIFDHVYADAHPLIDEEREQFAAYLDTFEGSHS